MGFWIPFSSDSQKNCDGKILMMLIIIANYDDDDGLLFQLWVFGLLKLSIFFDTATTSGRLCQ